MENPESNPPRRILVAPLDWGLGHATRCIPLIRSLIRQNAEVVLAGEGALKTLLEAEFPQLPFAELKGYGVSYSKNRWTLPFTIASQIPKIISAIQYENERLADIVKEHRIGGIISDNRYGLYHPNLPSVFMTHQLLVKTGLGKTADGYLQKLHYEYINKFSACWIPDHQQAPGLAGELSHPATLPAIPVHYLGPLSRMDTGTKKEDHLLIILSGPEPQRTLLENILLEQLENYKEPVVMVRGLPAATEKLVAPSHIRIFDHLPAAALNQLMNEASFIISRCGYSTVMDLAAIGKKSILIPTPGQTEQEYLGGHLMNMNFALSIEQNKFRLNGALHLAGHFPYTIYNQKSSALDDTINKFLSNIKE